MAEGDEAGLAWLIWSHGVSYRSQTGRCGVRCTAGTSSNIVNTSGGCRSHDDDGGGGFCEEGANCPAATMVAWFRVDLARATTTAARNGVTPSVLHIEHGEGDEVTRHHKRPDLLLDDE
jgi:hypothetical protein